MRGLRPCTAVAQITPSHRHRVLHGVVATVFLAACAPTDPATIAGRTAPAHIGKPGLGNAALVAQIRVIPPQLELDAGESRQLSAQVENRDGGAVGGAEVVFTAADMTKLTVSDRGLVRSLGPAGNALVRVASGLKYTDVPVHIRAGMPVRFDQVPDRLVEAQAENIAAAVQTMAVRITDNYNNPVPDIDLVFRIDGPYSLPIIARTDLHGVATVKLVDVAAGTQQRISMQVLGSPTIQTTMAFSAVRSIE